MIDSREKEYCIRMRVLKRLRHIEKYKYLYALYLAFIVATGLAVMMYTTYRCLYADATAEVRDSFWLTLLTVLKFDVLIAVEIITYVDRINSFRMATAELRYTCNVEESLADLNTSIQRRYLRKMFCVEMVYTVNIHGRKHGKIFRVYLRSISTLDKSSIRYLEQLKLKDFGIRQV